MKIIGIVGTRKRDTSSALNIVETKFFELYKEGDWICSGGCRQGADRFAEILAKKHGIPILIFYPPKKKGGVFIRNGYIAEQSHILIACVASDRIGGTEDTIKKFLKNKKEDNLHLV